jgi:hypothetical protein
MFSGFNSKKDFGAQQSEFTQHLSSNFGQSLGFLQSVKQLGSVDDNIDNMSKFLEQKVEFIDDIPDANQGHKVVSDISKIKLFISLGVVDIESETDTAQRQHLQLNNLNTAKFQRKPVMNGMKQYFKEYIAKLNTLKGMSIDELKVPDNTGYQIELKNKLKVFINKTKYFIFDIYLNHYVQYMYLLFAINIYKTTESFFVLNAEQQKQLSLLDRTNQMLSYRDQIQANDSENFEKIKVAMNSLIEKTGDISKYNKPTQDEISKLKTLDGKQSGGSIGTAADGIIESILDKHNHFFEVYKDTRNSMPGYFNDINELIVSKIEYLQELSNTIMTLEPEHFELLKKTNEELTKIYTAPDLQKNYKIEQNPIVKQNMDERLANMSKNIADTINNSKQYAKTLQDETNLMITNTTQPITTLPMSSSQPIPTQQNPMFAKGGFVRAGTVFPKNNYKREHFPLK